ncbi:glycosyltransferase family 2 protein [Variovorax sp. HJSM1_2]|uniref:glycosyltransferase family 2 protein n=1 Tax=Variovorax sp. HJSM1_2 TaxID=3366263 RepID=UPI003BC03D1B
MPTLSVVVITYQRDALLAECLKSLSQQTLPLHEVVVVDDGGSGSARAVVEQFGAQFHYVWQPNGGQPKARNLGSRTATGDWIAYLDDDDLWLPERHALLSEVMACDKADLIVGDFIKFGEGWLANSTMFDEIADLSSQFWQGLPYRPGTNFSVIGQFPVTRLLPVHPFWPSAMAVHRSLLGKLNGWNENLRGIKSEDFEFAYRAIRQGKTAVIWTPTVHYRCHAGNDSSSSLLNAIGRMNIWKILLHEQELLEDEVNSLKNAIEVSYHEILWAAFLSKDYSTVVNMAKNISKDAMSCTEKLKVTASKLMILKNKAFT